MSYILRFQSAVNINVKQLFAVLAVLAASICFAGYDYRPDFQFKAEYALTPANQEKLYISDITDFDELIDFRGSFIAELARFLVLGFGREYNSRIMIKPWFSLDPENKKPKASLIYWQYSF